MDKLNGILEKFIMPISISISNNKYLIALRNAFMLAFPITMFASIILIIQNIPSAFGFEKYLPQAYIDFMNNFLGAVPNATMNVMALFVAFGIAYYLAEPISTNPVFSGIISLSSFLLLIPFYITEEGGAYIPVNKLGAQGMFVAIVVGIIVGKFYCALEQSNIKIKMPDQVPPAIAQSFEAIIPAFLVLLLFAIIRFILSLTTFGNVFDLVYKGFQAPLEHLGGTLPSTLIAVFVSQIFWWFGVHGQVLVNSVMDPIWNSLALQNYTAFTSGQDVPHIISASFMGVFPIIGGNGMTLGAIILAVFIARSTRLKKFSRMILPSSFFNISEPITFGLPIVLNPIIIIPWILGPMAAVIFDYFFIKIGLVPAPIGITVPWTTPVFLGGWLATNSIRGGILQLFNIVLVALIWVPFLKIIDRQYLKEEQSKTESSNIEAVNNETLNQ